MIDSLPLTLKQRAERIRPLPADLREQARGHLNNLTKPIGSLGNLESIAEQLAAFFGGRMPDHFRKAVYIFAADHGVCAEGVSLYPSEVTAQMVRNFCAGGAAVNVLARVQNCALTVVDVGVNGDLRDLEAVEHRKIRHGSRNMASEAAMTEEELLAALNLGCDLADAAHVRGQQLIAVGEMGIGNTTAASAITSLLTGQPPEKVTGTGAGLDEQARRRKAGVIAAAVKLHFGDRNFRPSAISVLQCVGGLEIAAMAGFYLAAAAHGIALICDGFISTAAAALAVAFEPKVRHALFAGHASKEPGHRYLLDLLELQPILHLNMRLGEGSGAILAMPILESAAAIYREMATFTSAGVSQAQ